jgi:L-rhamnose isomerase/sugar isomerase
MIQTVTTAHELFAKALLVDFATLRDAQTRQDVIAAEEILRGAYQTDTRPLIGHLRQRADREPDALGAFRTSGYETRVAAEREAKHGQPSETGYA